MLPLLTCWGRILWTIEQSPCRVGCFGFLWIAVVQIFIFLLFFFTAKFGVITWMWQGFMCLFCYVSASCKLLHWTKISLLGALPKFSYNRLTALSEDGSLYWAFIELSDAGKLHSGRAVTLRKYLCVLVSQCNRWPWYNWVKVKNEDMQDVPCCLSSQVQLSNFLLSWSLST